MSRQPLTILFSGMLAGDPGQGGATWAILQYVLGFQRLGHDVYLVEPVESAKLIPGAEPDTASSSCAVSPTIAYFRKVVRSFGLTGRCALLGKGTRQTVGMSYDALLSVARNAHVLFNVSGMLDDPV